MIFIEIFYSFTPPPLYEDKDHQDSNKAGKFRGMGIIEYTRTRDAHRALIMINGSILHDRTISVRQASEVRTLPEGLTDLGRPLPEQQCVEICRQENYDPFAQLDLFVCNLTFDITEEELSGLFNLIGDAYQIKILFDKDDTTRPKGQCIVRCNSAIDAVQCRNVLNDSVYKGRKLIVRLDINGQGVKRPRPGQNMANQVSSHGDGPVHQPGPNPPNFGGPPASTLQNSNNGASDQNRVAELANLLGFDVKTLEALKQLKSQTTQPKQETPISSSQTGYNRDNHSYQPPVKQQALDNSWGGQNNQVKTGYQPDRSARDRSPHYNRNSGGQVSGGYNPNGQANKYGYGNQNAQVNSFSNSQSGNDSLDLTFWNFLKFCFIS